jgi:hypothetical protein
MSTIYEGLINELKLQLNLKKIGFNKIVKLINNQKYDEIVEIIDDEHIQTLIDDIVSEREKIGNNIEKKLNNLIWLNERLIQFEKEPQTSKTQALKLLRTIFINIYDLEAEKYEKRTTRELLQKELRKHPFTRYPLHSAKENETLKCFLIKIK